MNSIEWNQLKALLDELLPLDENARRARLSGPDVSDEIRAEAFSLLSVEERASDLMNLSAIQLSTSILSDNDPQTAFIGKRIGIYRVVRELDDGGMGAVYLATRDDGKFEQRVAIKLLRRELNTPGLRRRFEKERRILASLEHKNIARLLDAGTTNDRVPYFVMEYVEGLAIDHYCDHNELGLDERLDLFREVCEAVNFAHRNLIVHRDIKPSNILVDHEGTPKLLDFGISKIIADEFDQTATVTRLGAMTPSYASPEQIQNKSVTTATDIYSLGVVLYKLLSGHRPFETRESDLNLIYQAVVETDPPPPSSMVKSMSRFHDPCSAVSYESKPSDTASNKSGQTLPNLTAIEPQDLKGDLDNIILKALKKEPERRYSSAENFAEDIHRYQRGLTVSARPDVFSYRAAKFVRRNRFAVGAAALMLIAVLAGIAATLWQYRVAAAERDRARKEAQKAERINSYMQNILNFNNPHWLSSNPERNLKATVAEAMDEALKHIDVDLANEPDVQAEILFTLAFSYNNQGQHAKADKLLRQAIEKFDKVYGPKNTQSMQASVVVADILSMGGKYDESAEMYRSAIDYFRQKVVEDRTQSKWLATALNDLGSIYGLQGKYQAAEELTNESIEHVLNITGRDRYVVPIVWANLGTIRGDRGDIDGGIEFFNKALDEMRLSGADQRLEGAIARMNVGKIYNFKGDYKTSERYFLEGKTILETLVGLENVFGMFMSYHLVNSLVGQERYVDALLEIERIDKTQRTIFPKGHVISAYLDEVRGTINTRTGAVKKGETQLIASLDAVKKQFKEPSQEIALAKESLGENLIAQRRFSEARSLLAEALDSYIRTRSENHPFTKRCRQTLDSITNQL